MSRRASFHVAAAFSMAVVAIAMAVAVVAAKPVQALPRYESTCSTCHSATAVGGVTATPSKATLAPGEAYTVNVAVGLGASGQSGWWISSNDGSTPAISIYGGPGTSPFTANMTAPNASGTYTYKVWGVKGVGSAGQALPTTYQITVASAPAVDSTAPVTTATGAVNNRWYKSTVTVNLSATDNGGSGVDFITYAIDGGADTKVTGAAAQAQIAVEKLTHANDGVHTITYFATDKSANAESTHTLTVKVDTTSPRAAVLANTAVKKGRKATVKYKATDGTTGGTAVTTIKIKNRRGKVVKTIRSKGAPENAAHSLKFRCKLAKGVYKMTATSRDQAGNVSKVSRAKRLTVK